MKTFLLILYILIFSTTVFSLPPQYKSFKREQRISPNIDPNNLIRIWMIYVGQGDSILIQIPEKLNKNHSDGETEMVDILVDTGSYDSEDLNRAQKFLRKIYHEAFALEHVVLTHHDKDHVSGLNPILEDKDIAVNTVWHNGLASYHPEQMELTEDQLKNTVNKKSSGTYIRIMGELTEDKLAIKPEYIVNDLQKLSVDYQNGRYQGIYKNLAKAVLGKAYPDHVSAFKRAVASNPFIDLQNEDLVFDLLWPDKKAIKVGNWGETINGNSVTFRLRYHDFEMLFTGDHNEKSQKLLVKHLKEKNRMHLLESDVLKVPHHGSSHADKSFFTSSGINPVLGVASMGKKGFESNWKHPAEEVISYLGGSHKFYSTYIHEKRFKHNQLIDQKREAMREIKHILIESDGYWFRIVEISNDELDLVNIPKVSEVTRSNGTRWIKASED